MPDLARRVAADGSEHGNEGADAFTTGIQRHLADTGAVSRAVVQWKIDDRLQAANLMPILTLGAARKPKARFRGRGVASWVPTLIW